MFFFQAEDGIRDLVRSRGLGDVYKRQLYASSASIVEVWPSCIVEPKDAADVLAVVSFARGKGVPITARGAGSGVAGGRLGAGFIFDFSVPMLCLIHLSEPTGPVYYSYAVFCF